MAEYDAEHLQEIFSSFGEISVRKLFGGKGVYHKGLIFGIVFAYGLRLRGDEILAPKWAEKGCFPTKFIKKSTGKEIEFPYYNIPDACLEDPDEMRDWARDAYGAALRADAKKK